MKKILRNIFSALILLSIAAGLVGLVMGWWDTMFFEGWWTLFIIIPAIYFIIESGFNWFNILLLGIGVALLVPHYTAEVTTKTIIYIVVAIILVAFAVKILFFSGKGFHKHVNINIDSDDDKRVDGSPDPTDIYSVKFNSETVDYSNREFNGTKISVSFGAVKLDLRNAIINTNVTIDAEVSFSGLEILLPDNATFTNKCDSSFGGVDVKRAKNIVGEHTITLTGKCSFGGIDVK